MSLADGITKVAQKTASTITAAQDAADTVRGAVTHKATGYSKRVYGRGSLPETISIVDVFHKRLFSYVDFDFVLNYLKSKGWSKCEDIYTIQTLANRLIPDVTTSCLVHRNARKLMELYPGVIKLCLRHRKGLLVHIDMISGRIFYINSIKKFLEVSPLADGVALKDIWLPTLETLPKLRPRSAKSFVTKEDFECKPSIPQTVSDAFDCHITAKGTKGAADVSGGTSLLSDVRENNNTSIFADDKISVTELFKAQYDTAVKCATSEGVSKENAFDVLMHKIITSLVDCSQMSINQYAQVVAEQFASVGITDFITDISNASKSFMKSFRLLYDLPEGNGESNAKWTKGLFALYKRLYKISDKEIKELLENFSKKKSFCVILDDFLKRKELQDISSLAVDSQTSELEVDNSTEKHISDAVTMQNALAKAHEASQAHKEAIDFSNIVNNDAPLAERSENKVNVDDSEFL